MYDNVVDVPRLLHTYGVGEQLPHPALTEARDALSAHYLPELGEPFVTAGCCYYRDGHDSVAWHGDSIGRGKSQDTMVAIVSFGSPRKLQLRPVGGHIEVSHALGPRRPDRDGRVLPAHLGARRTEDRASGRSPDQRAVPAAQRVLSAAPQLCARRRPPRPLLSPRSRPSSWRGCARCCRAGSRRTERPPVAVLSKIAAAQSGQILRRSVQVSVTRVPLPAGSKVYSHDAIGPGMNGVRGPILRTRKAKRRPGSAAVTTHSVRHRARPRLLEPSKTSPFCERAPCRAGGGAGVLRAPPRHLGRVGDLVVDRLRVGVDHDAVADLHLAAHGAPRSVG